VTAGYRRGDWLPFDPLVGEFAGISGLLRYGFGYAGAAERVRARVEGARAEVPFILETWSDSSGACGYEKMLARPDALIRPAHRLKLTRRRASSSQHLSV